MTTLTEVVKHPVVREKFTPPDGGGRARGLAADPQPGHDRRQRVAGHALLVLPRRLDLLPRRRQHLLRRHADGDQPRARDLRRRPLRRGEPVGHGAGAARARRADGHPRTEGRARRQRRGLLDRPGHRHHAHERARSRTSCSPRSAFPATMAGAQFYFEKVRDRQVWDFPLVNVASAIKAERRQHRRGPPGRQRGRGDAAPAEERRSGDRRQAAQ